MFLSLCSLLQEELRILPLLPMVTCLYFITACHIAATIHFTVPTAEEYFILVGEYLSQSQLYSKHPKLTEPSHFTHTYFLACWSHPACENRLCETCEIWALPKSLLHAGCVALMAGFLGPSQQGTHESCQLTECSSKVL